ncbi:MAG: molybdopterin dinucleotide binding domain-containing protein [Methanolinea sp.]|nr:molybdopterin dinucleotide binding domain-containing protein [Methanolinea sp.]
MKFLMTTGRTIRQGSFVERKNTPVYAEEASTVRMNPVDMLDLLVEDGDPVRVTGPGGSVVMRVAGDPLLPRGIVFACLGPHANAIVDPWTHATGMPDYKTVPVEIEPAEERPPTVAELMGACGGVPYEG